MASNFHNIISSKIFDSFDGGTRTDKIYVQFCKFCIFITFTYSYCYGCGARGGVVVKALATNRQVAGSFPDGVIGIFR